MATPLMKAIAALAALALVGEAYAAGPLPTPVLDRIVQLEAPHALVYAMRGMLGDGSTYVGFAVVCPTRGRDRIVVEVHLGGCPHDRRPVQLAVRRADGAVERFGPVLTAGPESGFHSPQLTDPREAERFAKAALRPGSLISNGYNSFWNRASETRNREARETFLACLRTTPGT